jgi:hypothetical protein
VKAIAHRRRNLFAMNAELAGAASGAADGEHSLGMSFAAGALGAAAAVAGDALEQEPRSSSPSIMMSRHF